MNKTEHSPQPRAERVDAIVVDFDKTFIRENLLTAWVLFVLLKSSMKPGEKLRFLFQGFSRGVTSYALSHHRVWAELAVKIAYGTFRGAPTVVVRDFILDRSSRNGRFALNLNDELIAVLHKWMRMGERTGATTAKIVITSQGSPEFAIRTFLTRPDVVEVLQQAGIGIDPAAPHTVLANHAEIVGDHFTGRLVPPIITKYNRLLSFPARAVFVGDGKDEWALRALGKDRSTIAFFNYRKLLRAYRKA